MAAISLAGALLAGCVHVGEAATVNANGSSTEVLTVTLSPAFSSLAHTSPGKTLDQFKTASERFPGKVSVSPYKDPGGWKGVKVVVKLKNLAELEKLETMSSGGPGGTPMFSTFSISHHGTTWTLLAKVAESGFLSARNGPSKSNPLGNPFSKKTLEAMGMRFVISFKLPGRPVSSNATSTASNGALSWDMFKLNGTTLRAAWVAA